jgi:hypothetical protein
MRKGYRHLLTLALAALLAGCGTGSSSNTNITSTATASGDTSSAAPAPAPAPAFQPSVAIHWDSAMLAAFKLTAPRPTVDTRIMLMVSEAMYDAWAAYDPIANGTQTGATLRRPVAERTIQNQAAAASYAAYHVLVNVEPDVEKNTSLFIQTLAGLGYDPSDAALTSRDPSTPAGLGGRVADAVIASRANDNSNQAHNYADVTSAYYPQLYHSVNSGVPGAPNAVGGPQFNPLHWVPLLVPNGSLTDPLTGFPIFDLNVASSYSTQTFVTAHWGAVTPFALTSPSQFRSQPPPVLGSQAPYTDALGQTMTDDAACKQQEGQIRDINAGLDDTQKCIADYWADITHSVTPPGHWNVIAQEVSWRDHYSLEQDVKMFLALNGALHDSAVACWENKRAYDHIRPISAIQNLYFNQQIQGWGGPGLGTQTLLGQNWRPFQELSFVTPAFPDTTSGHSTFSAAGAEILTRYSGSNRFFDGVTSVPPDEVAIGGPGTPVMMGKVVFDPHTLHIEPTSPSTPVTLQWSTFQEAADEAGFSRRIGGIHVQDADIFGRRAGTAIADQALDLARQYWTGQR